MWINLTKIVNILSFFSKNIHYFSIKNVTLHIKIDNNLLRDFIYLFNVCYYKELISLIANPVHFEIILISIFSFNIDFAISIAFVVEPFSSPSR